MPLSSPALALSPDQKSELEGLARSGNTPQKVALRCRLLLLANDGIANQSIAEQLSVSRPTVLALRDAFAKSGLTAVTGIRRRKRAGRVLTPELEQKIVDTTVKTRPGDGSTHWSVRMLANRLRVSRTIVHRVWKRHDIQPHRVESFKLSNDPFRRVQHSQWQGNWHLSGSPPQPGVHPVPQPSGNRTPYGSGSAPHHGQLLHPQERRSTAMAEAEEANPIPLSLHPHQQFVAEPGGTLLRPDHRTDDPKGNLPQHRRTREGYLQMARNLEWRARPIHVACLR